MGAGRGNPRCQRSLSPAHSLKGAARVTGLLPIEALAHQLESLFAGLRARPQPIDGEVLHAVSAALDAIEDAAAALLEGRQPADPSQLLAELDELFSSESEIGAHAQAGASIKGPTGGSNQKPGSSRDAAFSAPSDDGSAVVRAASRRRAPIQNGRHCAAGMQPSETVRLSTVNLDRLLLSTSQLLTESLKQDSLARELNAIQQRLGVVEREWESLKRTAAGPLRSSASRLS